MGVVADVDNIDHFEQLSDKTRCECLRGDRWARSPWPCLDYGGAARQAWQVVGSAAAAEDGSSRLSDARALARSDHVIEYAGRPLTDIKKSFRTAVGRAGLPAWLTPHVLKHSVISWLAEDGYTVDRISDMTDTDAVTVRRIYRKVKPEALEDMATSLAEGLLVPKSATAGRTLENGG